MALLVIEKGEGLSTTSIWDIEQALLLSEKVLQRVCWPLGGGVECHVVSGPPPEDESSCDAAGLCHLPGLAYN